MVFMPPSSRTRGCGTCCPHLKTTHVYRTTHTELTTLWKISVKHYVVSLGNTRNEIGRAVSALAYQLHTVVSEPLPFPLEECAL